MEADPELEGITDLQNSNSDLIEDDGIDDWSQLAKLQSGNNKNNNDNRTTKSIVPKRGTKDFEPISNAHITNGEYDYDLFQLNQSRELMYNALQQPRGFSIKRNLIDSQTIYIKFDNLLPIPYIISPRGKFLDSIGSMDKDGKTLYLTIEESLFLIERGSCLLKFEGIDYPLSLEDAYSLLLLKTNDFDYNDYLVYRNLKTFGYIVQRYTKNDYNDKFENNDKIRHHEFKIYKFFKKMFMNLIDQVSIYIPYTRYSSIFKYLNNLLYPLTKSTNNNNDLPNSFKISFNVWKPNTKYKKKNPPRPDFQVVINDCNSNGFLNHHELSNLLNQSDMINAIPQSVNKTRVGIDIMKLKQGNKRIVIATIDNGIVNFNQISMTDFRPNNGKYEDMFTWRDEWLNPKKFKKGKKYSNNNNNESGRLDYISSFMKQLYPFNR